MKHFYIEYDGDRSERLYSCS